MYYRYVCDENLWHCDLASDIHSTALCPWWTPSPFFKRLWSKLRTDINLISTFLTKQALLSVFNSVPQILMLCDHLRKEDIGFGLIRLKVMFLRIRYRMKSLEGSHGVEGYLSLSWHEAGEIMKGWEFLSLTQCLSSLTIAIRQHSNQEVCQTASSSLHNHSGFPVLSHEA